MLVEVHVNDLFNYEYKYHDDWRTPATPHNYRFHKHVVDYINNYDTYLAIFSASQQHILKWMKETPEMFKIIYEGPSAYNKNYSYRVGADQGNIFVVWEYVGKETKLAKQLHARRVKQKETTQEETTSSSLKTEASTVSPVDITVMEMYSVA